MPPLGCGGPPKKIHLALNPVVSDHKQMPHPHPLELAQGLMFIVPAAAWTRMPHLGALPQPLDQDASASPSL